MRVLIVDKGGYALDFAMRCLADGHRVKHYIPQTARTDQIGKGLVEIVSEWTTWMKWADLVFLPDNTRYIAEIDAWRRMNPDIAVISATTDSARLELDRGHGMKVLAKHGIAVAPLQEFKRYDDAIAYVKRENRRFVSKPCGDEPDKSLTYVASGPADMVYMLERWKKGRRHKGPFLLQEFIGGTEMAVGGWIGPAGFAAGWWCENWEFKKLMNGEKGVATGEQGTVIRNVGKSKLADQVLAPLEDCLVSTGHTGYVDVNCIVDDDGTPWPLEFTMRPGWPTFNIQQSLITGDHAEWLADLALGQHATPPSLNSVSTGVVMSIPDYPYSHITRKEVCGIPIITSTRIDMSLVSLCEVSRGTAPQDIGGKVETAPCLVTAGDYVLVAMGVGETVTESRRRAYRVLDQIAIPNSPMYRTDIGARLAKQLPKLQAHGFAAGMIY